MANKVEGACARDGFTITKSDTAALPRTAEAIFIGGAGDIKLLTPEGTTLTFTVVAGTTLMINATQVFSTDTTATNMIGLTY